MQPKRSWSRVWGVARKVAAKWNPAAGGLVVGSLVLAGLMAVPGRDAARLQPFQRNMDSWR